MTRKVVLLEETISHRKEVGFGDVLFLPRNCPAYDRLGTSATTAANRGGRTSAGWLAFAFS